MNVLQQTMATFPDISEEVWKQKIEKDLKGKSFNDLILHSAEGIEVMPFYTKETISNQRLLTTPFRNGDCKNAVYYAVNNPAETNNQALRDLQYGIDALLFFADDISINEKNGISENIDKSAVELIYLNTENCISIPHQHSCTDALVVAIKKLTEADIFADKTMYFKFSSSQNYFFEIAKYRAFRWLIARIQEVQHLPFDYRIIVQLETGKTDDDFIYNEILRNTTATMAAVLGGADYVITHPYILNDENAKRIAINTMHILKYESHFTKLPDTGKGSYYIEYLSYHMAKNVWDKFQQ
ncbi:MAG TPA: methylmalonyl-CoA mutase family protein [Chitinophagales bacterium]|nr:methylmalonyl-CoA mutase family protein [Chitinophagales bacterium]HNL84835.1 methylmalonyl-CoA mutase family protein [Chitinophagales bacterium]